MISASHPLGIDKILNRFGLMTIKKARHNQTEAFKLYVRTIAKFAQNDFGVPLNPDAEADAVKWSDECFDQMMREYEPGKALVGAWEL